MIQIIIILVSILAAIGLTILYPWAGLIFLAIILVLLLMKMAKPGKGGNKVEFKMKGSGSSGKQYRPFAVGHGREEGRERAQKGWLKYWLGKSLEWGIVIILIVGIIYGGWFLITTQFYKKGTAQAEQLGIGARISSLWEKVKNPEAWASEYYSFKNPEATEQVVKKGITFNNLQSVRPYYYNKDKIEILGDAHIDAIEETPSKVVFSCKDDENNVGKILIYGVSEDLQEQQEVNVNENMDINFKCEIDPKENSLSGDITQTCEEQGGVFCNRGDISKRCNGEWVVSSDFDNCCRGSCISATTGEKITSTGSELSKKVSNNEIKYKIVYIIAEYKDFITKSDLEVCSISRQELNKNKDLYQKKEENAQCVSGCGLTRLQIKTSKQPLSEDVTYPLIIGLVNDADWYGKISKVNSVDVDISRSFDLIGNCKESINNQISSVNEQINKSTEEKPRLNPFQCDFQLTDVGDKLKCSIVEINAKYNYIVKGSSVIEIVNKEKP